MRGDELGEYFNGLVRWLAEGGYSIVSHFLANYDVSDWDYAAHAMVTDAKLEVINSNTNKWEDRFTDLVAEDERWLATVAR